MASLTSSPPPAMISSTVFSIGILYHLVDFQSIINSRRANQDFILRHPPEEKTAYAATLETGTVSRQPKWIQAYVVPLRMLATITGGGDSLSSWKSAGIPDADNRYLQYEEEWILLFFANDASAI